MTYDAANSGDLILEVSAVAKAYGETRALTSCSLTLRRGEILVLMGENGSGKSTLIKILSGLVRPDQGEIIVAGPGILDLRCPARHAGWESRRCFRRCCSSLGYPCSTMYSLG